MSGLLMPICPRCECVCSVMDCHLFRCFLSSVSLNTINKQQYKVWMVVISMCIYFNNTTLGNT